LANDRTLAGAAGAALGLAGVADAAAQTSLHDRLFGDGDDEWDQVVSAGNGGVATASANGGAVGIADINSGGNVGSAVAVGDTYGGPVFVDGGDIANLTDLGVSAGGGTAIADASGGDYNLAFVS